MWGRITPSLALHTGASDDVSAAVAAVGAAQHSKGAENLILKAAYTKGTEDGLNLWVVFPRTIDDAVLYRDSAWTDVGGGVQLYDAILFSMLATAAVDIVVPLNGKAFYRVYQQRSGAVAVSGTFTLYHETHCLRIDGGS